MKDLIPEVLGKEKLKAELHNVKEASIIFDGTAWLGEALAIVLRFVQEDCKPMQHLVHLEVLAKPLKGNELSVRDWWHALLLNTTSGQTWYLLGWEMVPQLTVLP